jgi:hypothetical protein
MFDPVIGYDPDEPLNDAEAAILLKEVAALCEKWLDEGRALPAMIFALGTALKEIRDTAIAVHEEPHFRLVLPKAEGRIYLVKKSDH